MNRLRRHLNPAMVISVIALFAALGGGYALAFSGSGSLQKGAVFNIQPPGQLVPVRSLTGVGSVYAECSPFGMGLFIFNDRSEPLQSRSVGTIPAHTYSGDLYNDAGGSADLEFHISPADADKTPQVNLLIRVDDTGNCATSAIYVLALNTQQ